MSKEEIGILNHSILFKSTDQKCNKRNQQIYMSEDKATNGSAFVLTFSTAVIEREIICKSPHCMENDT